MLGFNSLSEQPLSSLQVVAGGSASYADNLSVGTYTLTGNVVTDVKTSASTAYADNLSAGGYTYTGKSITDLYAHNDTLSTGSYTYTGKSITDVYAHNDALSKGTYTLTGVSITDVLARNDSLSKGTYTYTGLTVNDVVTTGGTAYADSLLVGTYSYAGLTLSDSKAIADSLSKGTYSLTGVSLTDLLAKNDTLAKGTYSLTGQYITDVKTGAVAYSDTLNAGIYSLIGQSLSDSYNQLKNDLVPIHGWIRDKRPSKDEEEAERIKLGIIEAKKEIKQVVRLLKQVDERTESITEASKLAIHKKLLDERIKRANDEYEALLRRINTNYLRARLEAHKAIKRQQAEENDIVYLMSMLASL